MMKFFISVLFAVGMISCGSDSYVYSLKSTNASSSQITQSVKNGMKVLKPCDSHKQCSSGYCDMGYCGL